MFSIFLVLSCLVLSHLSIDLSICLSIFESIVHVVSHINIYITRPFYPSNHLSFHPSACILPIWLAHSYSCIYIYIYKFVYIYIYTYIYIHSGSWHKLLSNHQATMGIAMKYLPLNNYIDIHPMLSSTSPSEIRKNTPWTPRYNKYWISLTKVRHGIHEMTNGI